jgi:hypothetical protein
MAAGFVTVPVLDGGDTPTVRNFRKWSDDGTLSGNLYDVYVDPVTLLPINPASTVPVAGADAHDAIPAANPFSGAVLARTSPATAVSNGDVARSTGSIYGETLAIGALRELKVRQKSIITSAAGPVDILTLDAAYKQDLYGLIMANRSATGCYVTIKDDTATVSIIYLPPTDTRGFMLPVDSAIPQTAANKAWTATCSSAAIDSIEITALAVKHL